MDAFDRLNKALDGPPKVTQREFAEKTGVPQSQISLLSQKKRPPNLAYIPALNRALGTTYEDWAKVAAGFKRSRKRSKKAA